MHSELQFARLKLTEYKCQSKSFRGGKVLQCMHYYSCSQTAESMSHACLYSLVQSVLETVVKAVQAANL